MKSCVRLSHYPKCSVEPLSKMEGDCGDNEVLMLIIVMELKEFLYIATCLEYRNPEKLPQNSLNQHFKLTEISIVTFLFKRTYFNSIVRALAASSSKESSTFFATPSLKIFYAVWHTC